MVGITAPQGGLEAIVVEEMSRSMRLLNIGNSFSDICYGGKTSGFFIGNTPLMLCS
jgi:hypothetical protein